MRCYDYLEMSSQYLNRQKGSFNFFPQLFCFLPGSSDNHMQSPETLMLWEKHEFVQKREQWCILDTN